MKFFVLEPEEGILFGRKWAFAEQVDPVQIDDEGQKCPVCGLQVVGRRWLPPHHIRLSSSQPSKWGDFVWGSGFQLIVSAYFKECYTQEKMNGIKTFYPPAMIKIPRRNLEIGKPTYHIVNIRWDGANLDDKKSVVIRRTDSYSCTYHRGGVIRMEQLVLEEGSWKGDDIFIPRGKHAIIVTERFKAMAEDKHLKNVWFIPIEQYAYDEKRIGSDRHNLWYIRD